MRAWPAILVLALGCDSKATASDPSSGGMRPDQKSKEFESCGATMHCQDDLRCFDQMCQRPNRSNLGDYYAAVGRKALAAGDATAAVAAYKDALDQYDQAKIPVPPPLDCEYGAALASARGNKENAELGARVLHRCVLAVPPPSALRRRAMDALALIGEAGLDPALLDIPRLADTYLTKGPQKPATDKLVVSASASPPFNKSMPAVDAKLAEPDVKAALIACWEQYHAAAKKPAMSVTVGMKGAFVAGEYEDDPLRFKLRFEPPVVAAGTPEAAADACARAVLEPAIQGVKFQESFTTKLTITVK